MLIGGKKEKNTLFELYEYTFKGNVHFEYLNSSWSLIFTLNFKSIYFTSPNVKAVKIVQRMASWADLGEMAS